MSITDPLSGSATTAELGTRAKTVVAGRTPLSVLAINGGSSSLRFTLFKTGDSLAQILTGKFERIGLTDARLSFTDLRASQSDERTIDVPNHGACVPLLVELLEQKAGDSSVSAIGGRVVHGGPRYRDPQRVDEAMIEELRRISSFAPNPLPSAIALMENFAAKFPQVPQIACFDTACHHTMPRVAKLLPIPRRYEEKGRSTLWFSRFVLRISDGGTHAPRRSGSDEWQCHPRASWQRCQHGRHAQWQEHGYQHGLHADCGADDEHPFR